MKVTFEASDGKRKSLVVPLTREEEKGLFKKLAENKDSIDAYNTLAIVLGVVRNWGKQ
jgi:hypothetical protein